MKSIFEQLNNNIRHRANVLSTLTHILQEQLPLLSHDHFHVIKADRQTLYIICDSAVWATRIRQLTPQLLKTLAEKRIDNNYNIDLKEIISSTLLHINVSTKPGSILSSTNNGNNVSKSHDKRKALTGISEEVSTRLAQTAEAISDDSLRKALLHLSKCKRSKRKKLNQT